MLPTLALCLPVFLLALGTSSAAASQAVGASDAVAIRAAAILVTLDSFRIKPDIPRIWIQRSISRSGAEDTTSAHLDSVVSVVRARYPSARTAPAQVFLCPPGIKVKMPGRGCPVVDGGIIVRLGDIRVSGGRIEVPVSVVRSTEAMAWSAGHTVVLVRASGQWTVFELTDRWIT